MLIGHAGNHNCVPTAAWIFLRVKDQDKIDKAGYATPRGGAKGAYQNHVVRSNRVIVPFERIGIVPLEELRDGYLIRLFPDQFFESAGKPKVEFTVDNAQVEIGANAFILYGTHKSFERLPPLASWQPRAMLKNGVEVAERRGSGIVDVGHYVLRMPRHGRKDKLHTGPPQGLFAPEYADQDTNFLCRCVLAWLIVHTSGSPYTTSQASHLKAILEAENLLTDDVWENRGVFRHGLTACPLCTRFIKYDDLHAMLALQDEVGLANAHIQVEGATRSTIVNLFHLEPLRYESLDHIPSAVAWGHATCNTKLGQRKCYSLHELTEVGGKLGIVLESGIETIGWISPNWEMIRSARGAVWIRICADRDEFEINSRGDPSEGSSDIVAVEVE